MNIIKKLSRVSSSVERLSQFNLEFSDDLHAFFINQIYSSLCDYRDNLDNYLHLNYGNIKNLDYSVLENQIFLDVLLDACERLYLVTFFKRLYKLKRKHKLYISKRIEASYLCINGLRIFDDFSNKLPVFLEMLQDAFETEEDNNKRVLAVFFNYYSIIVRDFGQYNLDGVKSINESIKKLKENYSFLSCDIADEILAINVTNSTEAFLVIHSIVDAYLNREVVDFRYADDQYLIELDTDYIKMLSELDKDVSEIRNLSCKLFNKSNDVYESLGRGVSILNDLQQLYAYLHSYGNMHFAKCNYAYKKLPADFFNNSIEIIDYGCGQALASMTYLDFLNRHDHAQNIERITLNEPSVIALKRGAAHIKFFEPDVEILTINKMLDDLNPVDFTNSGSVKLHLFSNILDIDNYSTKQLSNLIKGKFKGLNYFVIISPNITELKTNRIDSFIKEFDSLNPEVVAHEDKGIGEWIDNWTMVLRMFKVNIL